MRLAVSNIAWPAGADADAAAATILRDHGVEGVEIAPTKVWPRPLETSASDRAAYRQSWERRGLPIVALQALLFGRPDLTLFDGPAARAQTIEYLKAMIPLAAQLGAEALVFGSPKNRRVGSRPAIEVDAIARATFRTLGDCADRHRVAFCIEPNPLEYQCDYITSAAEGADLVARVASPGFALHLDTAAMTLAGDPFELTFTSARSSGAWRHFHISEPDLAPIDRAAVAHRTAAAAARRAGYARWASIEMKEAADGRSWAVALGASLSFVRSVYFPTSSADRVGASAGTA
jgi:sugar phosphate isomerase/epimerase